MFNTLPSAHQDAATAVNAGVPDSIVLSNLDRYDDVKTYFDDNTAAQKQKFGPRYAWVATSVSIGSDWFDVLNLTGPGVMQFLALWGDSGSDALDQDLRVIVDDATVLEITDAWVSSDFGNAGYILFGTVLWDDVSHVPLDPPYALEAMPYRRNFKVQVRSTGGPTSKVFKALHRSYETT